MANKTASVTISIAMPGAPRSGNFQSRAIVRASTGTTFWLAIAPFLLELPVRIVWMLQIPKRPAAANNRDLFEVVFRRRRRGGPFERPGVPWIVARFLTGGK